MIRFLGYTFLFLILIYTGILQWALAFMGGMLLWLAAVLS